MKALVLVFALGCGSQQAASTPQPLPTASASAAASTGASATPPDVAGASTCAKDSDCVVTTAGPCCSACLAAPHAVSRDDVGVELARCGVVECMKPTPPPGGCPQVESPNAYRAMCQAGRCEAVKK